MTKTRWSLFVTTSVNPPFPSKIYRTIPLRPLRKVRAARAGEKKSGGYRVIVYFRKNFRTFFVYGFAKSYRSNIEEKELRAFKNDANDQFALTDEQIVACLKNGTLIEVLEEF
jgi:hypothetical protein